MTAFGSLIITILFFLSVPGSTHGSSPEILEYVGCYDPSYSLRQKYHHHINSVTLHACAAYCWALKTRFAGVEASDNFCYCGADIPEESVQRNNTLCNLPCPDDPSHNCGGDWLMSVYDIGGGEAVVTENVDFLLGLSTGVRMYHSPAGADPYDTLMTTSDWAYAVDYHFSKNLIFAWTKNKLYKTTLDPKRGGVVPSQPSPIPPDFSSGKLVKSVSSCDAFAVDWVDDRIFWADCRHNGTAIMSMTLNGEAEQTLMFKEELGGKIIKRMEVDPYKRMVFWTADGTIQSCDMSGEGFNPNVSRSEVSVRALSLDLQQRRVFFVGAVNQSTSLLSVDYTGNDEVEHLNIPQFRSVYGLSILGQKAYWVNYAAVKDVIYEAPLNMTGTEEVTLIRTIDRAVWHMRVVHPSLQTRPKIDPCLDKGCAHACVARSATSARCECPPGQTLHHDGVSCIGQIVWSSPSDHVVYKGCYTTMTLDRRAARFIFPFVPDNCLKLCSGNGFSQAGLDKVNSICYCGDDIEAMVATADEVADGCSPCVNATYILCGGEYTMALYKIEANTTNGINGNQDIESKFGEEPLILVAGDGGVYSYNTSEKYLKTVIEVQDFTVTSLDYNLRKGEAFAVWDDIIFKFPLFEEHLLSEKNATLIAVVDRCMAFAVDWVHGIIFYPDCLYHKIKSVNFRLDHFPEQDIIVNLPEGAWALDMAVDPYKGLLFWTSGATLWSCRLDGRNLRKLVPEFPVNRVSSLSLDLAAERVYFSGTDKEDKGISKIFFADYEGTDYHPILEFVGASKIMDFGIYDHHVYFIKSLGSNSSALMSTKLGFNHLPTVIVKARYDETRRLRLVHPRLQSPGKEDACTNRGCSHLCVLEASEPRCYCPPLHELDLHNNRTCDLNPSEEHFPVMLRVLFGLMLVLIVLLAAGVLMCLSDKLWTQMHQTAVTLSTPGATTRSFIGQSKPDTENLI